jgi:hypothetical protein
MYRQMRYNKIMNRELEMLEKNSATVSYNYSQTKEDHWGMR